MYIVLLHRIHQCLIRVFYGNFYIRGEYCISSKILDPKFQNLRFNFRHPPQRHIWKYGCKIHMCLKEVCDAGMPTQIGLSTVLLVGWNFHQILRDGKNNQWNTKVILVLMPFIQSFFTKGFLYSPVLENRAMPTTLKASIEHFLLCLL